MTWRSDYKDRLRGDASLAAELAARIGWFEAQRGWGSTYPQLVLTEVSVVREATHQGHDGLDEVWVQHDIWAESAEQLETIEAALLVEMEQATVTQGGTVFHYGHLLDRAMDTEDLTDTARLYRLRMDFQFFHETV